MTFSSSLLAPACSMTDVLKAHLVVSARATERLAEDPNMLADLRNITKQVLDCFSRGGKLLILGNGGSAADALHIAAEFVGRFKLPRAPLPAIALTGDTATLTAVGNDFGYPNVFSRQVEALGKPSDLLWAISTSGASPNVLYAMRSARALGMPVAGFTSYQGRDSGFFELCSDCFAPPIRDTAVIQQLHMIAAHAICDAVERELSE